MSCDGPKTSPSTSSIVQIIFSFRSFGLRNQKIIIGLDKFSNQRLISLALIGLYTQQKKVKENVFKCLLQ